MDARFLRIFFLFSNEFSLEFNTFGPVTFLLFFVYLQCHMYNSAKQAFVLALTSSFEVNLSARVTSSGLRKKCIQWELNPANKAYVEVLRSLLME